MEVARGDVQATPAAEAAPAPPAEAITGFRGVRTSVTDAFAEGATHAPCAANFVLMRAVHVDTDAIHVATHTIHLATNAIHLAMKVDYGESRHFCDDPVCPDPVWKLSRGGECYSEAGDRRGIGSTLDGEVKGGVWIFGRRLVTHLRGIACHKVTSRRRKTVG